MYVNTFMRINYCHCHCHCDTAGVVVIIVDISSSALLDHFNFLCVLCRMRVPNTAQLYSSLGRTSAKYALDSMSVLETLICVKKA